MESDLTRQLLLEIFQVVKPHCLIVSELALHSPLGDTDSLVHALRQISTSLASHHEKYASASKPESANQYIISTKLADYIFFPISNLLKHPLLPDLVVQYILEILAFLTKHSWSHDIDIVLLEQLFTLCVYLSGGDSVQKSRVSAVSGRSSAFVAAVTSCLVALFECVPRDYYLHSKELQKRLSLLGDATTILMDVLDACGPGCDLQAASILRTLSGVFTTRVTPEQTSFVFPGIVSKVVNFQSKSKNLSADCLLAVLDILQALIVKVFSDQSLEITISDDFNTSSDLLTLSNLLEDREKLVLEEVPVKVTLENTNGMHRTNAWLNATSKQLKISLLIFMKNLILSSGSRTKIVSNPRLADGILAFVSAIVRNCFKALFREVIPSTLDMLSAYFYVLTADQQDSVQLGILEKIKATYLLLGRSDLQLLSRVLYAKTQHLVSTQLPQILYSASEEKICLCVSALKVHVVVIAALDSALLLGPENLSQLSVSILEVLSKNMSQNVSRGSKLAKTDASKNQLLQFLGGQSPLEISSNSLDEIELPPHIDAKHLGTINKKIDSLSPVPKANLVKKLDLDLEVQERAAQFFSAAYSTSAEKALHSLAAFLGCHCHANSETSLAWLVTKSGSLDDKFETLAERTVSLWLANSFFKSSSDCLNLESNFDIDEFLEFDDDSEDEYIEKADEEASYMLLQTAQILLEDTKSALDNADLDTRSKKYTTCERAYSVALETIGILASRLNKVDFQADVLIDYLYPLLEALTYTPDSQVHFQAKIALKQIVDLHYENSLEKLINDNADYLINSLSMNLLVSSGLTPSLPGILVVVIRISGTDLLLLNQLQDILSEIFIVIDSFHGYSSLVENFFYVFQEIVLKVNELYGSQLANELKLPLDLAATPFKPWGLKSREKMLQLIDDANKLVDPFEDYNPDREYFHREAGVPFGDQAGDSDDDDDNNEEEVLDEQSLEESPAVWPSPVPKNIYISVQQLFTYGLQLLSHPSIKLRIQILRTLKDAYKIMSSNYKILMPILAQYWPLLLVLSSGASGLSEFTEDTRQPQAEQLIVPSLELMLMVFEEDEKHEMFMASRFLDMWSFMKKKAPLISGIFEPRIPSQGISAVSRNMTSPMTKLYSQIFIRGIEIYEKAVPDLIAHEMVKACYVLGIDNVEQLGRNVQNHLWVLLQNA